MIHRLLIVLVVFGIGIVTIRELSCCYSEDDGIKEIQEPEIAAELRKRFESDQVIRNKVIDFCKKHKILDEESDHNLDPLIAEEYKALVKKVEDEDRKNRLWLKEVVVKHGWPGKSLVGSQAAMNAWLLVQHADDDREFQQECLTKMEAMPTGEVRPVDIAYLTDRVLCGTGKKQKYGTQAILKDGKVIPNPIEDEVHVDERRKALGLEPLMDYLKMIEKVYGVSSDPDAR